MDESWLSDTTLVERVRTGDAAAYRLLVDRHYPMALRIAGRVLGSREEAEDAVQESFLKLWKAADRYDASRGTFKAWIGRVVVNQCLDRRRTLKPVEALDAAGEMADDGPTPEDAAVASSRGATVAAAMDRLPPRQRAVLALFYGEGHSMLEVAEMLELNVKAVESLLSRGRAGLRQALEPLRGEMSV